VLDRARNLCDIGQQMRQQSDAKCEVGGEVRQKYWQVAFALREANECR
jgi:hypothetical protein